MLWSSSHLTQFVIQDKTTRPASSFKYWSHFINYLIFKCSEGEWVYFLFQGLPAFSITPVTRADTRVYYSAEFALSGLSEKNASLKLFCHCVCTTCRASHLNCVSWILTVSCCDPLTSLGCSGHWEWVCVRCMWVCVCVWEGGCNASCLPRRAGADKWHRGSKCCLNTEQVSVR